MLAPFPSLGVRIGRSHRSWLSGLEKLDEEYHNVHHERHKSEETKSLQSVKFNPIHKGGSESLVTNTTLGFIREGDSTDKCLFRQGPKGVLVYRALR